MKKSRLAFLLPIALSMGLSACSKVEYDFKTLGFVDKTEMESAFSKGYHTKKKLDEMTPMAAVVSVTPTTVQIDSSGLPTFKTSENYSSVRVKMLAANWVPFHSPNADECYGDDSRCKGRPEMEACAGTGMANCLFIWKKGDKKAVIATIGEDANLESAEVISETESVATAEAATQESNPSTAADTNCSTVQTCVQAMLISASSEKIGQALDIAKQIDSMPKPNRGDRKEARKFNKEGLEALKNKNYDAAAAAFIKGKEADPLDDEIIGNLAYTYGEAKKPIETEEIAYEALLLNPRRANYWSAIASAKQAQGKPKEALQAMWLVWQFAQNKQSLVELFDKKIIEEADEGKRQMYVDTKAWVVNSKKPNF